MDSGYLRHGPGPFDCASSLFSMFNHSSSSVRYHPFLRTLERYSTKAGFPASANDLATTGQPVVMLPAFIPALGNTPLGPDAGRLAIPAP
jgi:hypothetical protein